MQINGFCKCLILINLPHYELHFGKALFSSPLPSSNHSTLPTQNSFTVCNLFLTNKYNWFTPVFQPKLKINGQKFSVVFQNGRGYMQVQLLWIRNTSQVPANKKHLIGTVPVNMEHLVHGEWRGNTDCNILKPIWKVMLGFLAAVSEANKPSLWGAT